MRVIRPEDFKRLPKKRRHSRKISMFFVVLFIAVGFIGYKQLSRPKAQSSAVQSQTTENQSSGMGTSKTGILKQFSSQEFQALALSVKYPNTQLFREPPAITGNPSADQRIRTIAETRGYQLTSIPVSAIVKINEPRLENDDLLQPLAAIGWQELKTAAQKDNIPLAIISAYRSPEYQRDLFMKRLLGRGVSVDQIAAGQSDAAVESTLGITALPGYSRHHTGYTIDLWCEDRTGKFASSSCYKWIRANNFQKAKEIGWIPSYPDGVEGQGPEPEPWEYVWVGKDMLTN